MDNAIYVGLSRAATLQRALDLAANNIANMDTAGFKVEQLAVQTDPVTPKGAAGSASGAIKYVLDNGVVRNFGQGELETTGNTFDLGIEGDGFFSVQTAAGTRYTRDGRFSTDAQNRIVDKAGNPVLDAGGSPITVNPTLSAPTIARDGTVSQTGPNGQVSQIGKIGVVRFANLAALSKGGDNLYADGSGQAPQVSTNAVIHQGAFERSNVQPISEITNLIEITRTYERVQDMMGSTGDLSGRAIDALGKLSS